MMDFAAESYPAVVTAELWWQTVDSGWGWGWGWATAVALLFILAYHYTRRFVFDIPFRRRRLGSSATSPPSPPPPLTIDPRTRVSEIVSEDDLKFLFDNLEERPDESEKWEMVTEKRNSSISYMAKCSKPKDGPIKYLSVTSFENCSPELLRNFYMDNDYRMSWDKTVTTVEQLEFNESNGTEIGRMIKKFPLLTSREYVIAWRLWEGYEGSFYCFTKECEHPSAPRQRKFVRVGYFRSGWRISKVPGRNASEIRMFHQEDAGLNMDMAKMAFSKGIWSYVCKMDNAFRKYSALSHPQQVSAASALSVIQKVPPQLDNRCSNNNAQIPTAPSPQGRWSTGEITKPKKLLRKPSKKFLANGAILLGGVLCLTRGNPTLGAKVAMAYILTKLNKRGGSSSSSSSGQGLPKP